MDVTQYLLLVKVSIVLTVLGLGLQATWRDATMLLRAPGLLMRSVLSMNVVMPVAVAALAVAFDLPLAVKIALVALAISPVPPILPKKELKAGGDSSYAIGLLVAMAVLAIITVPVSVSWFNRLFARTGEIAPQAIAGIVLTSVLAPLATGISLRQWAPALAKSIARPVTVVGAGLLVAGALPLAFGTWPVVLGLSGTAWC
jgi:BASS family bile acid:Na+ symporter